jgi:hypothetical protein
LREAPRSGGFHLTLAHRNSPELLSVEFNSRKCSIETVQSPALHANHMIHAAMRNQPQIITGSSAYRQLTGDCLLSVAANAGLVCDPLEILRSQVNQEFPIYRDDPEDSDNENTMATVDIWVHSDRIQWEIHTDRSQLPLRMTNGHQYSPAQEEQTCP